MARVIYLLILILLAFAPRTQAAPSCSSLFDPYAVHTLEKTLENYEKVKKQLRTIHRDLLREKVRTIFWLPGLSRPERIALAFEAYMQARIQAAPAELKQAILEGAKNIDIRYSEGVHAAYRYSTKSIYLEIPKAYKDTIGDYALRVHELEHLIQNAENGNIEYRSPESYLEQLLISKAENVHRKVKSEEGAMYAEAIFLQSLPKEEVLLDLHTFTKFIPGRLMFEGIVNSKTPEEYIQRQWAFQRYSEAKLTKNHNKRKAILAAPLIGFTGMLITVYILTQLQEEE